MSSEDLVKLTNEDIKWMVKRVSSGKFTVKQASLIYGVTERRGSNVESKKKAEDASQR